MQSSRTFLAVFAVLAVAAACSSAKNEPGPVTETKPAETAAPGNNDAGAPDAPGPTPAKDSGGTTPEPSECGDKTTQTACVTCCSEKHEDGAATYFVALIDCMCTIENCLKECEKTLCEPTKPSNADAACQACVSAKSSACGPSIKATCTADPDCTAFDKCVGQSDCPSKPQ